MCFSLLSQFFICVLHCLGYHLAHEASHPLRILPIIRAEGEFVWHERGLLRLKRTRSQAWASPCTRRTKCDWDTRSTWSYLTTCRPPQLTSGARWASRQRSVRCSDRPVARRGTWRPWRGRDQLDECHEQSSPPGQRRTSSVTREGVYPRQALPSAHHLGVSHEDQVSDICVWRHHFLTAHWSVHNQQLPGRARTWASRQLPSIFLAGRNRICTRFAVKTPFRDQESQYQIKCYYSTWIKQL